MALTWTLKTMLCILCTALHKIVHKYMYSITLCTEVHKTDNGDIFLMNG